MRTILKSPVESLRKVQNMTPRNFAFQVSNSLVNHVVYQAPRACPISLLRKCPEGPSRHHRATITHSGPYALRCTSMGAVLSWVYVLQPVWHADEEPDLSQVQNMRILNYFTLML